jgi:hypothetical protein
MIPPNNRHEPWRLLHDRHITRIALTFRTRHVLGIRERNVFSRCCNTPRFTQRGSLAESVGRFLGVLEELAKSKRLCQSEVAKLYR